MNLCVHNLRVAFAGQEVVHGVSFDVAPGESVGIVGESGSGKSSIVHAITHLTPAHVEGEASLGGIDLFRHASLGTKIGMVFQDPLSSLNPTMNIGSQITEGMLFHKLADKKGAKEKSLELLRLVDISEPHLRLRQYPHELSGGMRQRIAIAIALACNPQLLIADEPTSALDAATQSQVLQLIRQIQQKRNMSLLLITHDLKVVADNCDRVLVLHEGKIVEQGLVQDVLQRPQHPYTQMLVAASFWRKRND